MNLPAPRGGVSNFQFHPHLLKQVQDRLYPLPSREREYYISPPAASNGEFQVKPETHNQL